MDIKKTPQADMEQRRATGFLLGLILVLAMLYVALEWNTAEGTADIDVIDLTELMHETELVPMSNEETIAQLEEKQPSEKGEQLNIVDDDTETEIDDEETDGDDEQLLKEQEEEQDNKALAPMEIDPQNALNFHVVEELPQYPGGAVEFLKWLTKTLRYPALAKANKTEGKVVAVFYVEKDGSITGIQITKSLTAECDREALRVLRMMPKWQPGIRHDEPCRTKVCIPIVFKL